MPLQVQVPEVTAFLRSRHVRVVDEWTVECLDWLQQEYQGQNVRSDVMKQYVYDQWLDSDLTEIASPVLPQGITQQRKTSLTGSYALQINLIQDISMPAYGQLQKLQGKENENALVSAATQATQQSQNKFEPKSGRMLMLQLTDGHQSLQGMEYQPILQLSVDTLPGTKVLVKGSIPCRQGILMLTADNVQVLGGDVESLAETNSKLHVLANALRVDGSQGTPQNLVQTTSGPLETIDLTTDTADTRDNMGSHTGPPTNRATLAEEDGFFSDDLGDDLDALMLNEIQQIEELDQLQQQAGSAAEETEWPSDDDDIDEMLLEQVEQSHLTRQATTHLGQETPTESKTQNDCASAPFGGVQDQRVGREQFAAARGNVDRSNSNRVGCLVGGKDASTPKERTEIHWQNPNVGHHRVHVKEDGNSRQMRSWNRQDESSQVNRESGAKKNISSAVNSGIVGRSSDRQSHAVVPLKSREFNGDGGEAMQPHGRQVATVTGIPQETAAALPESIPDTADEGGKGPSSLKPFGDPARSSSSLGQDLRTGSLREPVQAAGMAARIAKPPGDRGPALSTVPTTSSDDGQRLSSLGSNCADLQMDEDNNISAAKRRRFHSSEGSGCVSVGSPSLVTLSSVLGRIPSEETLTFTIKGFVVTLLSPLSRKEGRWSIAAKISDKTASQDVDLSDEVLTGLIGFSVPEMMKMKKSLKTVDAVTAKEVETKLRQGLAQCQKSLIEMHCAMTVEVGRRGQRPLVTSVGTTDPTDLATFARELPNAS